MVVGNSKVTLKGKITKDTKTIKASNLESTSSVENKDKTNINKKKPNPKEDGLLIGMKSKS